MTAQAWAREHEWEQLRARQALVQLPVGGRAALVLGGLGHRGVHGGRDRVALGAATSTAETSSAGCAAAALARWALAAVGLPVLAARAVLAGVEQYPVVAPGIAALLTLGQAPGQQPAHRVGDRATGAQLLVQAPDEPVGEHLRGVRTACEALHAGQLAAGGGLHGRVSRRRGAGH
ncbi:hypothetical protein JQK87_03750 [Streptomyces sp. G44]|uniref:hypothetical protein n=1 Tax=Streptomyces sp. G44 TaxID=2807632 RepID=UPI00195F4FBD|nr:hypothetical protein [Streptomyces sp. G44]MBM7167539.1 hypothetical protein [Streptomyces sp. G44]